MKPMPKSFGFTLIELLIAISIIAVLAAIGFTTYSTALKQGRDSKRQSDLRTIQSALEQYYSDQGFYPVLNAGSGCSFPNGDLRFGCALKNPTGTKTYINTAPTDPIDNRSSAEAYYYKTFYLAYPTPCDNLTSATKCTTYCLYAKLEGSSPGLANCMVTSPYNHNFAVTPP